MPFSVTLPSAVATSTCGVCRKTGHLKKYLECKSLDSGFAPLWMCSNCNAIYNATAENEALDVEEWQKRWSEDDTFYSVPDGDEYNKIIADSGEVFKFFSKDLGIEFSGDYVEIGAGSGLMAASAAAFFDRVHVFDHVRSRLEMVQKKVGEDRYFIRSSDDISQIKGDVVLIWHALEHFLAPGAVFELCVRILKPGGVFLAQVPVLSFEHVYPGHYYFYCEKAFEALAGAQGMEIVRFYYDHGMNAMTVAMRKPTT